MAPLLYNELNTYGEIVIEYETDVLSTHRHKAWYFF